MFFVIFYHRKSFSINQPEKSFFQQSSYSSFITRWRLHSKLIAWNNPLFLLTLRSASSNLCLNTNHNINIKAEPISPPRDHLSHSGYMTQPHGSAPHHHSSSSRAEMGRSPADSVSSSCSSHEGGSDRDEQQQQQQQQRPDFHLLPVSRSEGRESPSVKRMRMDSWVT